MQNKPNPQNPQSDPTLYHQEVYEDFNLPENEKNKPKTNPIQPNPNTLSAPRPTLPNPRLHKSAFCLPIPTTSGFRNFAFCLLHFDFSLPALSPKSAQVSVSAHKLSAKTSKNHNSFAQNKPNPQNPQISPTPYPKKAYKDYHLPGTQKNKPNSNPIPTPQTNKTNPIQTQIKPNQTQFHLPPNSPRRPNPHYAIRYPLDAAQTPPCPISHSPIQTQTPRPYCHPFLTPPYPHGKWIQTLVPAPAWLSISSVPAFICTNLAAYASPIPRFRPACFAEKNG